MAAATHRTVLRAAGKDGKLADHMPALADTGVDKVVDASGETALHRAAGAGAAANVAALLSLPGAHEWIDVRDRRYKTALMHGAEHAAVVALLLEAGACPNAFKANSWSPLMYAAKAGAEESVALLLGAGASVDWANKEGATAVYLAAREGHAAVVESLLAAGGGGLLTQGTLRHRTPLHTAIRSGHVALLRSLLGRLEAGVVGGLVDASGQSLHHEAAEAGSLGAAQTLVEAGLAPWPPAVAPDVAGRLPLHVAVLGGHLALVQWLLECRPPAHEDSDVCDAGGTPALYHAAAKGLVEVGEVLLGGGADPAAPGPLRTPLHIAALNGRLDMLKVLVQHLPEGSPWWDTVDAGGKTVRECAKPGPTLVWVQSAVSGAGDQ